MEKIKVKDKEFSVFIPSAEIENAVKKVADEINTELKGLKPLFLVVLNGAFLFAADLVRLVDIECEVSFIKLASYDGTSTTGKVTSLIGLKEDIKDRVVIVVEDIVDTGITLDKLYHELEKQQPASIKVAALLHKPEAYRKDLPLDYIGIEVPNRFLLGYGLDYDGLGRNLKDIYVLS